MEKRTVLALAISFMVLGFYPMVLEHFYPGYYKRHAKPATSEKAVAETTSKSPAEIPAVVSFAGELSFDEAYAAGAAADEQASGTA